MKLRGKCTSCRKTRWFLFPLSVYIKGIGQVFSEGELCHSCRKSIKQVTIETNNRTGDEPVQLQTDEETISN